MALKFEVLLEGEEEKGPIDLEASMAKLRALLEQVDDAQHSAVTLRLSGIFSAHQTNSGPDWDPKGQLSQVWQSQGWVVYAPRDQE